MPKTLQKQQKSSFSPVVVGQTTQEQERILSTLSGGLESRFVKRDRPSVYYKPINGRDLFVHMIIDEYNSKLEDRIYSLQANIISKYKDNEIDFRLTPKYKISEKKIIPKGFKKLALV